LSETWDAGTLSNAICSQAGSSLHGEGHCVVTLLHNSMTNYW